jgi:hypothetical protein
VVLAMVVAALASCSSDDDDKGADASPSGSETTAVAFEGSEPDEIAPPAAEGNGTILPQPSPALPAGYVEEEFIVGGTATSFEAVETPDDGFWAAAPAKEAEYRTRVIVRRPPAERFSGTVVVEWFNVSAIESAPDWAYLAEEIGRAGHVYIGVSAQAQGVEGGETLLDVEVDEETADSLGTVADPSGLKNIDPDRYGDLVHPGDAYAFDIFSQVGRAAAAPSSDLLGGLEAEQVIAAGESQSAIFLSTLVNAVHPLSPAFDGFLVHSRGANITPLDGDFTSDRERDPSEALEDGVRMRTDLDVPVLLFETETDLTLLGYAHARQPDTELVRTWEVAGTAHADAHLLRAVVGGPRDPGVGSLLGCDDPINTGPHHEVLQAAFAHLVEWAAGGRPPPEAQRIELVEGDEVVIARDDDGIARGGVRNPLVDVPVAAITGEVPGATIDDVTGGGGVCTLFGTTVPFDQADLLQRYGTADDYVEAFRASANDAVDAGFLLSGDADQLVEEAEANRALFE